MDGIKKQNEKEKQLPKVLLSVTKLVFLLKKI